ncbi:protein FAM200A-like [Stylophora pistillata]|uniref:protein FAM200A-like n=1 Tax=Stylophora pistillata TaxID=50429 RepID=UPI000C046B70|nr:protein FAM200A-like [Stylophora pistillata]
MQDAIATVLKSNIDKLVEGIPFFSLLIDESTDFSNHKNLVVYVKLLNEFKPELHFLENINVRDGKVETITTAVNLLMERRYLHKDKMTGFSNDGVSVMTGKNNGVSKRMKDHSAFVVSVHCMAHRLAICTSQAAHGIPYLAKFKEIFTALYGYFDKSALRSQSIRRSLNILS